MSFELPLRPDRIQWQRYNLKFCQNFFDCTSFSSHTYQQRNPSFRRLTAYPEHFIHPNIIHHVVILPDGYPMLSSKNIMIILLFGYWVAYDLNRICYTSRSHPNNQISWLGSQLPGNEHGSTFNVPLVIPSKRKLPNF